ncbi:MAG: sulfite exporter TauE/SafE family protein [Proteobacteria bacterium]|nr:sulfite exporter TauE/SafE family protein [Pseudomonadota bacterium]
MLPPGLRSWNGTCRLNNLIASPPQPGVPLAHFGLLVIAGLVAGTMNAIAGGGSFVGFPAMVLAGLPPIAANATNTVALFPGTVASTWAYRAALRGVAGIGLRVLVPVTLAGGVVGAVLLLITPGAAFDLVIPWLLLLATLTFAAGPRPGQWLRQRVRIGRPALLTIQFILSVYGGYFGGAIGLMMMAVWTLIDPSDLKMLAGARTALVSTANGAAILCFLAAGVVWIPEMLAMMGSAIIGGYLGARIALFLPAHILRATVVALSAIVTLGFFARMIRLFV